MARSRSPWRALRPVLLAGAATLTWLTFSSTAASADTLSDTSSLLGGVASSVSAASEKLLHAVPGVPATPAGAQPAGLLQPVVGAVAGQADNLISSVPVVQHVVPPGTVPAVTAPVTRIADGATSAVVEVVLRPVTDSVPVLEPVLDPVADLVTGTTPIPVPAPVLPGSPAALLPSLQGRTQSRPWRPPDNRLPSTTGPSRKRPWVKPLPPPFPPLPAGRCGRVPWRSRGRAFPRRPCRLNHPAALTLHRVPVLFQQPQVVPVQAVAQPLRRVSPAQRHG
jgi:hypothetical protein